MRDHRRRQKRLGRSLGTNIHLIGRPRSRERLATPALVLDLDALEHNLGVMADYCRVHNMTLRPHAKTHKSSRIAALQGKCGAVGICVATMREAVVMVKSGVRGVLITSPMIGEAKLDAIAALLKRDKEITLVVDSLGGAKSLEAKLKKLRMTARVLIDIDVGMKRTGVPNVRTALALARHLDASDRLELLGLQCYSGMVQHIAKYAERSRIYGAELVLLEAVLDRMNSLGLPTKIISGGGTGTFDIDRKRGLFTECQAGSYIFMDVQYNDVELLARAPTPFKTALFVQSMVLSNNHQGSATVDAGFKSFAMDGPVPVPHSGAPSEATFQFYGDEFGMLTWPAKSKRLPLARKVEFVTPHCDPTVNLHNVYHCVRGSRLVDIWSVDGRGSIYEHY
jgi:D-serine deaminase-like pyridoxal phosphate-dependent protein